MEIALSISADKYYHSMFLTLLVSLVSIFALAGLIYIYFKNHRGRKSTMNQRNEEIIVCRDIAEIFCNTISFINQLCAINGNILQSLEKLLSAISINNKIETHLLATLDNEIDFRMKEVENLVKVLPTFKLKISNSGKYILEKHKLSELEVSSTEMCVKQSIGEIKSNFQYLKDSIKGNQYNSVAVNFAIAQLKCFQYESNALFYGALEGLCSFPIESLTIYYEISPSWNNMPIGVTLRSMNKEGFKMNQELEFRKAQQCIDAAKELIDSYDNDVDNFIAGLKRKNVTFFIAGSKSLQHERDVFAGVVSILQSKWKQIGIDINSYSYQNFPREVTVIPSQEQYNYFIANYVNVAVFILNGKAGAYTMEEFEVAYRNFKKNGTPKIFVYSLNDGVSPSDSEIHQKMTEEKLYWIEFKDINELRLLLNIDLESYLLDAYSSMMNAAL